MDDKAMTIKDLVRYLNTLPQEAELFHYSGLGSFISLDSPEEIAEYFKLSEDGSMLFLDNARYEADNDDRIIQGKEWSDIIKEHKKSPPTI